MINNLFRKNKIDDSIEDEVYIEIEKPIEETNKNILNSNNINPNTLMRNYESIKVLSMNPQEKNKILELISESKNDLQKIYRIINSF